MKKRYMWLIIIWLIVLAWILFVNLHPVFWGTAKWFENSKNYINWKFKNLVETNLQTGNKWFCGMILDYYNNNDNRFPKDKLPSEEFNKNNFKSWDFVWFGHSTVLMNIEWKNIITDPVFYKASPISLWWKSFNFINPPKLENLPEIDIVLISHDHYDHLDYQSIKELDWKVWKFLVPLWVKSHLEKWNVSSDKIEEFDWYTEQKFWSLDFVFTPAKHFSGRGVLNRNSTLWWSWVVKSIDNSVFFSGDSWYFEEFKKIGEKYWPFDIAFIENGAYNESWEDIHMYPEQSVQVWLDLKANNVMPIHWGKFDLSLHSWYDPIERFSLEAEKKWLWYFHPKVWEIFDKQNLPKINWWNDLIIK